MADYEVLAPGGHAHLVSDVKSYADRAGGKGTTQLADGSVTRDKLADGVTDRIDMMHDMCDPLVGNYFFNELAEGTVLTTDDAYAAPPKGVEVYGKSTQAGTPTPDAPVPIKSVDNLTLHLCGLNVWDEQWERGYINDTTGGNVGTSAQYIRSKNHIPVVSGVPYNYTCTSDRLAGKAYYYDAAKAYLSFENVTFGAGADKTPPANAHYMRFWLNHPETYSNDICINISDTSRNGTYAPYVGQSVQIPLSNHIARSLPDGTCDELTLSYVGPSTEHKGWGVYSKVLTQRVSTVTFDGTTREMNYVSTQNLSYAAGPIPADAMSYPSSGLKPIRCDRFTNAVAADCCYFASNTIVIRCGTLFTPTSRTEVNEWLQEHPTTFYYELATPVTHDLGTIELPVNPAPDLTAWADGGSAQPTLALEYEQDINIVITRLKDAIADLATA